jgi:predicted AlkP superfamily phosphohydrolase/phosphomutase
VEDSGVGGKVARVILVGMDALQLCQVRRFADEGALPNFQRLLSRGSAGEALPELPAWTPTNWGTIATGALPGSTRLAGWFRRLDWSDLEGTNDISTFSSQACPSDTIWEAAERAGLRSLSIFHPLTWPVRTRNSMVVAPLYSGPGIFPLDISKSRIWTTRPDRLMRSESMIVHRDGDRFQASVAIVPSTMELAKEYNFGDKPETGRENVSPGRPCSLTVTFDPTNGTAELAEENGQAVARLTRGGWSDWSTLSFGSRGEGAVRFYLLSCAEDSEFGFALAHSSIYPTRGFTFPAEIAKDIVENVGPFLAFPTFLPGREGDDAWFEEYRYQGLWMARVARYLLETRGWDLYYQHFHVIDSAMHKWLHGADPASGSYDPATADNFVGMVRRAYEICDAQVGAFMDLMDDTTALMVVSDHGCIPSKWEVDHRRVLELAGLLTRDEKGSVIWEKTQAFMLSQRVSDVYINLKGRLPKGTVDPADYERMQERIIDALLDLRNPDGKRVVAYALKRKDAHIVGHYGPETGDVVFIMNAFHGPGRMPEGAAVRRAVGSAEHGTLIATTRTDFSSNLATVIIAGPGIRRGYRRDEERQGLWRLADIVPTIAHLLGFRPPGDSRGGVMYDVFEDN